MAFDFSTLVTDRTQQDVAYARQLVEKLVAGTATEAEIAEWNSFTLKGVYNHTDLNRVTAAMEDLKLRLEGYGYAVPGYKRIKIPHNPPPVPSASRLPEGYTELTYIESTGTQYVDTVVKMTNRSTVDLKLAFTSASYTGLVFGSRTSATEKNFAWAQVGTKFQVDYRSYAENRFQQEVDTNGTTIHVDPTSCIINGTEYAISGSDAFEADTSAYIFNASGSNFTTVLGKFKLYSCQIYNNGTLIRDFVPCINPSGDVGLFDVVNQQFYGNSGTGAFVAGAIPRELPEGYTQVEYIQSSGTQYIDTGIAFSVDNYNKVKLSVEMDASNASNAYEVNGTGTSNSNCFYIGNYNGTVVYGHGKNDATTGKTHQTGRCRYTIDAKNGIVSADGMTDVSFTPQSPTGSVNLYVCGFGRTNGTATGFSGKFYVAQIWVDDVLVRDFVPCKNSSGAVGLYDMVNGVFYQNAGSGAFTAGYEVASLVTAAVAVVSNDLTEYDPYTWYEFDWPTTETMTVYLLNVSAIRSVLDMLPTTPKTPADMELLTWAEANHIEQILFDVEKVIYQVVNGFPRNAAFTFWSGHRPFPSATDDIGRTWEELDAMNTTWANWQLADWYLLLYGNLRAEGVIE